MKGSELKALLFNPNTDKFNVYAKLKSETRFEDFQKVLHAGLIHPLTKSVLLSTPLPKKYSDLRSNRIVPPTENVEGEIGWVLYSILVHANEINNFIKLKTDYENAFLLNKLDSAEALLNKIEKEICVSAWSLENKLLLSEHKDGTSGNWTTLSDLTKEISDPLLLFFVEKYSKRAEAKISYLRFRDLLSNELGGFGADYISEYLCFKLLYPAFAGFKSFSFFIGAEATSAVVDRYLVLIDTLIEMLLNVELQKVPSFVRLCISQLCKKINDTRLKQIHNYLNPENSIDFEETREFISWIDDYTEGKFEQSIQTYIKEIERNPQSLELYELLVKALIETESKFPSLDLPPHIVNVLELLYKFFKKENDANQNVLGLLKISTSLFSSNFGKQLYSLITYYTTKYPAKSSYSLLYTIHSKYNNPRIISSFPHNAEEFKSSLKYFEQSFNNSSAIKSIKSVLTGDISALSDSSILPNKKNLYVGRSLIINSKYSEAEIHFEKMLGSKEQLSEYIIEEAVVSLYYVYLVERKFANAIALYVNFYLLNKNYLIRLSEEALLAAVGKKIDDSLKISIDLPIFFTLCVPDAYTRYVSYDYFMSANKMEYPSYVVDQDFAMDKVVFFLKYVCTVQTLNYSLQFSDVEDVERERLKILQILLQLDSKNEQEYVQEIAEIKQNSNIRAAMKVVNKGRITINTQQLKSSEGSIFKEIFNRYKELSAYSKERKLVGIDVSGQDIKEYLLKVLEDRKSGIESIKQDPAYISFKVMFFELRDKFLLSKEFGLDGYLSTRIRHGTLENHIRSIFEKYNLIAEKDKTGKYADISHWDAILPQHVIHLRDAIQLSVKEFSEKIDNTIQYILKELIQVYTEKQNLRPNAVFNYRLSEEYLWVMYNYVKDNVSDYNDFLDYAFKELESVTEINLQTARDLFNGQLKEIFVNYVDELHKRIRTTLNDASFIDLNSSIIKCRTEIQNELLKISEWFELSNPTSDVTLDIDTILKTSVEITNSIYPHYKISPSYQSNIPSLLLGTVHIIYITRILLDNIIKHSSLPPEEVNVEIETELRDRIVRLSFSNHLSENTDIEELKRKLQLVKDSWSTKTNFENINVEGGSGFEKIRRILAFDMRCRDHGFDYRIQDLKLTVHIFIDTIQYANAK